MTTPQQEIWCINLFLDSPNGNIQLVFNNMLKATAMYERLDQAMRTGDVTAFEDSYAQKGSVLGNRITSVLLNDTAASMRGAAEIGVIRDVANMQYQSRMANHPATKAAQLGAGLRQSFNGMGPANA